MSPTDYLRELALPLRSVPVMLTAFLIFVVIGFVVAVAIFSPYIAAGLALIFGLAMLPGIARYLVQISEWRAKGRPLEPPSAEMFGILGSFWQLSGLLILVAYLVFLIWLEKTHGGFWSDASMIAFSVVYPAMTGVLVITHSIIQACNPLALSRLIVATGSSYWYAPLTALAVFAVPDMLANFSTMFALIAFVYLVFAFFAVSGTVIHEPRLIDEVAIHDSVEPDVKQQIAHLVRERTAVLNHAYGFLSRGNRDGGLRHIYEWLARDPSPAEGWPWFFEQMLRWEQSDHALIFAQRYISELLANELPVPAVKTILRARLIDEQFRPLAADLPRAIEAAEGCGNVALVAALRRS